MAGKVEREGATEARAVAKEGWVDVVVRAVKEGLAVATVVVAWAVAKEAEEVVATVVAVVAVVAQAAVEVRVRVAARSWAPQSSLR